MPIILLTGCSDPQIDVEAIQAGAADYLVKDQVTPALLERSIHAIARKRAEEALHESEECFRYQRASLYQTLAARVDTEVAKRGGL